MLRARRTTSRIADSLERSGCVAPAATATATAERARSVRLRGSTRPLDANFSIASVLGVLSWNAGNKLLGVVNGVLFINFVPVTVFAIRIAQGHHFQPIEFVGAALVIGALIANNVVVRRATAPAQHGAKGTERFALRAPSTIAKPQGCG